MDTTRIIGRAKAFVRSRFARDASGHDWWHSFRVWQLARRIGKTEQGADLFVVELAALLHDVADWKFNSGNPAAGADAVRRWLRNEGVPEAASDHVASIAGLVSFRGANVPTPMPTIEGKIVQDADRLDALGAIGIARTFAYGGHAGRELYNPDQKPVLHKTFAQYRKSTGSSVNHFYEKLLLLRDQLNTPEARKIADKRHAFMETFLRQFLDEWDMQA